jgi:hypothetical protein
VGHPYLELSDQKIPLDQILESPSWTYLMCVSMYVYLYIIRCEYFTLCIYYYVIYTLYIYIHVYVLIIYVYYIYIFIYSCVYYTLYIYISPCVCHRASLPQIWLNIESMVVQPAARKWLAIGPIAACKSSIVWWDLLRDPARVFPCLEPQSNGEWKPKLVAIRTVCKQLAWLERNGSMMFHMLAVMVLHQTCASLAFEIP